MVLVRRPNEKRMVVMQRERCDRQIHRRDRCALGTQVHVDGRVGGGHRRIEWQHLDPRQQELDPPAPGQSAVRRIGQLDAYPELRNDWPWKEKIRWCRLDALQQRPPMSFEMDERAGVQR